MDRPSSTRCSSLCHHASGYRPIKLRGKELTHRADELAGLGWSAEDVDRYAELWDYRQRWGAMNLEREDRLFLRKAEAALPGGQVKRPPRKHSGKVLLPLAALPPGCDDGSRGCHGVE